MTEELNKEKQKTQEPPPSEDEPSPIHFEQVEPRIPFKKIGFWGAVLFSVLGVWFIHKVTFTDASKNWLPFTQETAQLLVPTAPDGQEPIELVDLAHTLSESQITVQGKIRNRTKLPIEDLLAIITVSSASNLNMVEVEVPLVPSKIEPGSEALFQIDQPVNDKPLGYTIKFILANGAIVRHKDSRFATAR